MLSRVFIAPLGLAVLLAGCAKDRQVTVAPPLPPPAAVQVAAPRPPDGAAARLTTPARLSDGSYATPNRAVSPAGTVWHLRAAYNVAALNCPDPTLAATYNRLLTTQRAALATAHRTLAAEHGPTTFDAAMTRLYNYFAQPPVLARFCAVAGPSLVQASALPAGAIDAFAADALAAIDAPFTDFYSRYDSYRAELAAWQAGGTPVAPRLAYDRAAFVGSALVTGGGRTTLAAR